MKPIALFIACSIFTALLHAQKDESKDYAKMKEELNTKIFGTVDPVFKENKVPEKYKDESAVVLAQKHSLESDSKMKFRVGLFASSGPKYSFFDIFRKKLFINDQSALKEYSQLNFNKLQSKDWSPVGKLKNYTFINIRLIKPNGTIKTIDVDESAVTVKNEKDQKENKIAIPDLSVGDIIDYYVANYYQEEEDSRVTSLNYVLGDDYPILNYVLSLQFDARISVEYQSINGAPDFKISPDADGGGNVLSLAVSNVPKIKGLTWSSPYKQLPIIRLNYKRGTITHRDMRDIKEGDVFKANNKYPDMIEAEMASIFNNICYSGAVSTHIYKSERATVKKAWKEYISKHPKANNPDSIASFVFRYITWSDYYGNFNLETNYDNAYYPIDLQAQLYRIVKFGFIMLLEFKTDLDLLILPGKYSYARENLFSVGDLSLLVKTHEGKTQYFSFADNFDYGNTVPYYLQGEQAKEFPFDTKQLLGGKLLFVSLKGSNTVTLPTTDHKINVESEIITAKINSADPQLLNINRKVSVNGSLKKDVQAAMTIYEEMAQETGIAVDVTDDLIAQNKSRSKSVRKPEDELKSLLEKARTKHKEDFEKEIERNYDTKAKEVKSYKILHFGACADMPFEFEEEFIMDGWIKKAGNNYIMDIGKLISSQLEIKKDQRERTKDIYMSFPRSFSYHIEFTLPNGYSAEGIDKLNATIENETGAFISKARMEGNKVVADVTKYYTHSFEPAAKWPLLLKFLDKAVEFNQLKILIKKL
ncbi:MAG TPA: DUF3857 domain-containing protein [Chitinophagaceae bacterium]|jgi:hypothetical protein|nr:DUF3857 domain-containing protein [Chitinophagaceae bacterium]